MRNLPQIMRGKYLLNKSVFENQPVERDAFHKVFGFEFQTIIFGVVEKVGFYDNGRGNIESFANIPYVFEEKGIIDTFVLFVNALFDYFSVFYNFCPNSYHGFTLTVFYHKRQGKINFYFSVDKIGFIAYN